MSDPVGFAGGSTPDPGKKKKGKAGRKKVVPHRVKLYAKALTKGMSKRAAARAAGYSESMAINALDKIERPNQEYFERIMDRFVPDELIGRKLREGLDSTLVKTATFEGRITDEVEYADMPTRARYLELAAEFKGRVRRGTGDANFNGPVMLVHGVPRPERPPVNGHINGQGNGNGIDRG